MAREVAVGGGREPAKLRNPWGVLGLSLVTLGIYSIFWWYFVNRELMDLGRERGAELGESPAVSATAWALGWMALFVPTVWTIVTTCQRILGGQRLVQTPGDRLDGGIAALVWIVAPIGGPTYMQYQLNKIWRQVEDPVVGAGNFESAHYVAASTQNAPVPPGAILPGGQERGGAGAGGAGGPGGPAGGTAGGGSPAGAGFGPGAGPAPGPKRREGVVDPADLELLERLAKMKEDGVITEEEFEVQKARILG